MRLLRGVYGRSAPLFGSAGCVLTIGNFDGVHRGHRALLDESVRRARGLGVPAAVLSFEPTPREHFSRAQGGQAPARVSTLRSKLCDLQAAGLDVLLLQRFSAAFAALPAQRFIDEILLRSLNVRALVLGEDFRFGAGRGGDLALLRAQAAAGGYTVHAVPEVHWDGLRCSSTALRAALAAGDLESTRALLGRPYRLVGRVRGGLQLGRQLGMPTANLPLPRAPAAALGVYAVSARVLDAQGQPAITGAPWPAVASLGVRPTLGGTPCLLEVHLLDRRVDLYGRTLAVEFHRFLRPEQRFDDLATLAAQMHADADGARAFFARADDSPA